MDTISKQEPLILDENTLKLKNVLNHNILNSNEVERLIELGANPNIQDNSGRYLLERLIQKNNDALVAKLIEKYHVDVSLPFKIPETYQIKTLELDNLTALGKGGFGKVLLGKYEGKEIAIKTFHFNTKRRASSYCDVLSSYMKEVQVMLTLNEAKSENLMSLIGIYFDATHVFPAKETFRYSIVMEYASMGSLHDIIKNNPALIADWATKMHIMNCVFKGLHAIGTANFIHGDFKSANVVLKHNSPLEVKIIDFGLSHKKDEQRKTGTPLTRAPETLQINTYNSIQSDIYSLGVVFYETVVLKIIEESLPIYIVTQEKLSQYKADDNRPYIPDNLCTFEVEMLINACWNNDPTKRPTTEFLMKSLTLENDVLYEQLKEQLNYMLTISCKYSRTELVKQLTDKKNIYEVYKEGSTPLLAACQSSRTHNNIELFQWLTKFKPALCQVNIEGKTALDLAFENNNESAIHTLMHYAKNATMLNVSIMSSATVLLAKEWVISKSLQSTFDDAFFMPSVESNTFIEAFNTNTIKEVAYTFQFSRAINKIRFFSSTPKTLTNKEVEFLVDGVFEGETSIEKIPEIYGLRAKILLIFVNIIVDKITYAYDLDALNSIFITFNKVAPLLAPNPDTTKTYVEDFLKNSGELQKIPAEYGIRDKAQKMKEQEDERRDQVQKMMGQVRVM